MDKRIQQAAEMMIDSFRRGGKLLLCGNGGSAADCAHITGELVKGFLKKRPLSKELQVCYRGAMGRWAAIRASRH